MDIIPPRPVQLYSVKDVVPTKPVDGVVQHNLLPQQFLQATVVRGGEQQVVLDLGSQTLTANSEQALVSGQKLNLQVLTTQPQLKLQIVPRSGDPLLLRLVNLFDHKTAIGSQLTQLLHAHAATTTPNVAPASVATPSVATANVATTSVATANVSSPGVTTANVATPSVATPSVTTASVATPSVATPSVTTPSVATPSVATPNVATPNVATPNVATPTVATPNVATPTVATPTVATPTVATPTVATPVLNSALPPPSSNTIVTSPPGSSFRPAPATLNVTLAPAGIDSSVTLDLPSKLPVSPAAGAVNNVDGKMAAQPEPGGAQSPAQILTGSVSSAKISPDGIVKPFIQGSALLPAQTIAGDKSTVLPQVVTGALSGQQWQQIEALATQLVAGMDNADGRLVQNLARALGLDFEFLAAQNKLDQTAPGLKGTLAALQEDSEASPSLRQNAATINSQLEVLQLCRLRLAQEGVLFLPLPFDFLQQGYALFERKDPPQDADGTSSGSAGYLVSLNMDLTALGPMQVNLLFEQQALYVRILCADDQVVTTVQEHVADLRLSLQGYNVSSVRVTTGAQDPALTLLRRLQPHTAGGDQASLLDERV